VVNINNRGSTVNPVSEQRMYCTVKGQFHQEIPICCPFCGERMEVDWVTGSLILLMNEDLAHVEYDTKTMYPNL
jgi:hypothetical protein